MTKCNLRNFSLPRLRRRKLEINFNGGDISSDGGLLAVSLLDKKLKITSDLSKSILPFDKREKGKVKHKTINLLRQRIYGIISGNEDLNDHNDLREDEIFKSITSGEDTHLAGSSTLCRFENSADRKVCVELSKVLVEKFVESFKTAPKELILDFDATDDAVHGNQAGRFFHGYYDHYCFLPLYVFCGDQLLISYLRPSKIDGAKHSWAILSLLVKRLRKEWPNVKIIFRGDSGFCRHQMFSWCEKNNVYYIAGIAKNKKLEALTTRTAVKSEKKFKKTQCKSKIYNEIYYAAKIWKNRKRKVIIKAEYNSKGKNLRYIITNITGKPKYLYEKIYCMRGDMENRIKEQQLYLFADRTSCHNWWPNQLRLILASAAYVILERLRALALNNTVMAKAQCSIIRLKLIKIGTLVIKNTRTLYINMSSSFPNKKIYSLMLTNILML